MQVSKARFLFVVLFVLVASVPMVAQTVTGTVTGTVVDPSDLAVPKANVSFTNEETSGQRTTSTDTAGNFVLTAMQPGRYTISVQAAGFKKYEKTNLNLTPNERLFVGRLSLEVGAVTESVVVTAQGAPVQVESQERSAELTSAQLSTLMVRGRNYTALLKTLPGVVPDSVGDRDWLGSMPTPVIGGSPAATNSITIDGLPSQHISNPNMIMAVVNMDAVSEVKVLLNNYNAEYGHQGLSRVGILLQAPRAVQRQQFLQQYQWSGKATIPLQHGRRQCRRTCLLAGEVQLRQGQAVLLLLGGSGPLENSKLSVSVHHANRSGTDGQLFADTGYQWEGRSHPGPFD